MRTSTEIVEALAIRFEAIAAGLEIAAAVATEPGVIRIHMEAALSPPDLLAALIDEALLAGSRPVRVRGSRILAAVAANWEGDAQAPAQLPAAAGDWRTKSDMDIAVATLAAVDEGRLYFLFQSIAGALDGNQALYQECFTRIVGPTTDDEMQTPRGFIPSLERLGLTRRFDRAVVEGGLDFLQANHGARVGCNISALSAVDDAWWAPVFARLAAARDIAERLVIEITETTSRADIEPILGFVRALRRVGCRMAIDNFGAGFSSLRFAAAAAPDVIKIDACYVREQAANAFGPTYLGHLVGLAGCLATEVVVVGIENDSDLARAREAAASWVQGRYVAPASLFRGAAARLVEIFTEVSRQRRSRVEVLSYRRNPAGASKASMASG